MHLFETMAQNLLRSFKCIMEKSEKANYAMLVGRMDV
jgi:hypothetical protein